MVMSETKAIRDTSCTKPRPHGRKLKTTSRAKMRCELFGTIATVGHPVQLSITTTWWLLQFHFWKKYWWKLESFSNKGQIFQKKIRFEATQFWGRIPPTETSQKWHHQMGNPDSNHIYPSHSPWPPRDVWKAFQWPRPRLPIVFQGSYG